MIVAYVANNPQDIYYIICIGEDVYANTYNYLVYCKIIIECMGVMVTYLEIISVNSKEYINFGIYIVI